MQRILAEIGTDINYAIDLLKDGKLVGIPTETVYGLAGNAYDANSVAQIFKVKDRPAFDPLIVHTSSLDRIQEFAEHIPQAFYALAKRFWPGPLTIILDKKSIIPDLVTSGLETVAVRVPNHPVTLALLEQLDFPLAAPSANPFGYVSPTSAHHVNEQLGGKIEYVLDGGNCEVGIESTILQLSDDAVRVLRIGGCKIEDIEKVIGKVTVEPHSSANPVAPGMLESHYSPLTPIRIGNINELAAANAGQKVGVLSFNRELEQVDGSKQFVLSEKGDLDEAATRLFTGLRYLDTLNLQLILGEYVPEEGLGRAINDRLKRAEAKRN